MLTNPIDSPALTITQDQTSPCFDNTTKLSSLFNRLESIHNSDDQLAVKEFKVFYQNNEFQLNALLTQNKFMGYTVDNIDHALLLVSNAEVDNTSTDECKKKSFEKTLSETLPPLEGLLKYELNRFKEEEKQQLNTEPKKIEKQQCSSAEQNADAVPLIQKPVEADKNLFQHLLGKGLDEYKRVEPRVSEQSKRSSDDIKGFIAKLSNKDVRQVIAERVNEESHRSTKKVENEIGRILGRFKR